MDKQFDKFWKCIRKCSTAKAATKVNTIGGCVGDPEISDMQKKHFDALYRSFSISVDDDGSKNALLQSISQLVIDHGTFIISVNDVAEHCRKQKKGKAVRLDGIRMDAFIFGSNRLHIHLAILFNCFIRYGYLPKPFMQSMIIPLLKAKSGDLTDVNNYRAIAIGVLLGVLGGAAPTVNAPTVRKIHKFGQLILSKITKIVATRCHILRLKCTKFDFGAGGTHSALQ